MRGRNDEHCSAHASNGCWFGHVRAFELVNRNRFEVELWEFGGSIETSSGAEATDVPPCGQERYIRSSIAPDIRDSQRTNLKVSGGSRKTYPYTGQCSNLVV